MLSREKAAHDLTLTTDDSRLTTGIGLAVLAVLLFSTSSVFIRLAAPISPYEITFWRMVVAAGTAGLGLALFGHKAKLPRERRYILYGLVAALHFLLFVTAVTYTSIAHALAITYLAPVFIAVASWRFLGERLTSRQVAGGVIALAGIAILVGFEPRLSRRMLLGDALALLSAACYAAYSLAGRLERVRQGLLPYATTVYGLAAVWLIPAFVAGFVQGAGAGAYNSKTVLALLGAGILPLGLGHTLYNASLRRIPATYANLIASQEVTGGVLLGVALLSEVPSANSIAGAAVAIAGIVLVLLDA